MTVVIVGENPEVQAMIESRRALGQDGHDEMWEGVYHVAPQAHPHHGYLQGEVAMILKPLLRARGLVFLAEFNLGDDRSSYRVPDFGAHDGLPGDLYVPSAAMVGEILSPDDETYAKFDYYADHGVAEIVVVDPFARAVTAHRLTAVGYQPSDEIACAHYSCADLTGRIDWP